MGTDGIVVRAPPRHDGSPTVPSLPETTPVPDCFLPADNGEPAVPVHAIAAADLPGLARTLTVRAARWSAAAGFSAAAGDVCLIPDADGRPVMALFGLGDGIGSPSLAAGALPAKLPAGTYRLASGFADPALASLAWALGVYRFARYRKDAPGLRRLVLPADVDAAEIARIADGVTLARDLVNTAANDLGPAELAEAARDLALRHGAVFSEIVGEGLVADGYPLIHAVGAAAVPQRAPRLIDLSWGDPEAPSVTLIGKGVCFDSGGLDIKPSSGMLLMKKDMGGAANALGLAHMIMDAGLPVRLRVLIPAVENAIAGAAFRPGDVFTARNGLSVEIGNTDAEGRLVLADALALASEDAPDLIVDLATLTGAARVALGPDVVPFYTRDDALAASLSAHAAATADPVWRMPLWAPYMAMLDSKIADINNAGSGGHAGSITAALFLSRFVPESQRWLHGDIFAWNPSAKPGKPEGGEAQAIRALYALLKAEGPRRLKHAG
jgi:leucyl aminopeptidase